MDQLLTNSPEQAKPWYRHALSWTPAIAVVLVMASGIAAFAHYGSLSHSMLPQPEQPIPPTYHNGQLIPNPPFPNFGGTPIPQPAPQPPFGPMTPPSRPELSQSSNNVSSTAPDTAALLSSVAGDFIVGGDPVAAPAQSTPASHNLLPQPEQPIPPTYHNGQLIPNPPFPNFGGTPIPQPAPQPPFGPLQPPLAPQPLNS